MVVVTAAHRLEEIPVDQCVDQCLELLEQESLGRLAYVVDGRPEIRPLNFAVRQSSVMFRIGYRDTLDAIHLQAVVFVVDGIDRDARTGWSVDRPRGRRGGLAHRSGRRPRPRSAIVGAGQP